MGERAAIGLCTNRSMGAPHYLIQSVPRAHGQFRQFLEAMPDIKEVGTNG